MTGERENARDWLAVEAGLRELFSALKFPVNREKYREFDLLAVPIRR
jgi:hypothetical protein